LHQTHHLFPVQPGICNIRTTIRFPFALAALRMDVRGFVSKKHRIAKADQVSNHRRR